METDRDKARAEKEKARAELQAGEDARFDPIEPKRQVAPLWTDEDEILRIADLRYEALIGPLETRERRVTHSLSARHSLGLSLDVVVARYQAWAPTAAVDPVSDGTSDAGSETVAALWPEAWSQLPEDKTRLRFEAGSGRFIDWLHHPWCTAIEGPCPRGRGRFGRRGAAGSAHRLAAEHTFQMACQRPERLPAMAALVLGILRYLCKRLAELFLVEERIVAEPT